MKCMMHRPQLLNVSRIRARMPAALGRVADARGNSLGSKESPPRIAILQLEHMRPEDGLGIPPASDADRSRNSTTSASAASPSATGSVRRTRASCGERAGGNPESIAVPPYLSNDPAVQGDIAGYYAEIEHFDGEVGEHLGQLDAGHVRRKRCTLACKSAFPLTL